MLEVAAAHGFHFDSCRCRLNLMDRPLPQLCPTGNAQNSSHQGIAVLGNEINGDGNLLMSGNGNSRRVPALRAESAGFRGIPDARACNGSIRPMEAARHIPAAWIRPEYRSAHEARSAALTGKYEPSRPLRSLTAPPTIPSGWLDGHGRSGSGQERALNQLEALVQTMKTTFRTSRWVALAAGLLI